MGFLSEGEVQFFAEEAQAACSRFPGATPIFIPDKFGEVIPAKSSFGLSLVNENSSLFGEILAEREDEELPFSDLGISGMGLAESNTAG